jgi:hypothetical protein
MAPQKWRDSFYSLSIRLQARACYDPSHIDRTLELFCIEPVPMIVLIIVSVTQPFPESPLSSPSSTFSSDSIPLPDLITHHLETIDARFSAKHPTNR